VEMVDFVDADDQKLIGKPALRAYLQSTGKIVICEELPYRLDEDPRFKQVNEEVKDSASTAYVPIGQNEIFVGSWMLGPRKGKAAYSAQEVATLKDLQRQATDAMLNARLYKQAVERIRV
jgi:GAF domain-containing protein